MCSRDVRSLARALDLVFFRLHGIACHFDRRPPFHFLCFLYLSFPLVYLSFSRTADSLPLSLSLFVSPLSLVHCVGFFPRCRSLPFSPRLVLYYPCPYIFVDRVRIVYTRVIEKFARLCARRDMQRRQASDVDNDNDDAFVVVAVAAVKRNLPPRLH